MTPRPLRAERAMHFELMRFGTYDFGQLSLLVWLLIGLALVFDFLNGFHDTANSIATVVSTRVLPPHWAVVWAAFFNFAAFLIFPLKVADTIAEGVIDPEQIRAGVNGVIFSTLMAACFWNLLTWWLALPTSSSHALIGGLIGSGLAMTGSLGVLVWSGVLKTVLFIVLAPLLGFLFGLGMAILVHWVCRPPTPGRPDLLSPVVALLLGGLAGWATFELLNTLWPNSAFTIPASGGEGIAVPVGTVLAGVVGAVLAVLAWRLLRSIRQSPTPRHIDQVFRKGQLLSAAWFSLTHGGNDA
ncbi:MAG TPA: inorganic phosphate transporter, partial [Gemmataceae bacterium]|nr:inorganic phosphate transporter [Gemmataceae bacterium]